MSYTLEARIESMSRTEARAVVRAILEMHGSELVEEKLKEWAADSDCTVAQYDVREKRP